MTDKPSQPEIHHPQAPQFNDRHMVVARTTTERLYVHLTRDEALERGQEAAGKRSQARALGEELAAHNKRVRADIKALENRAEHLERQCELEAELADVECDVIFDYQANEARTVRRDTGQLLVKETRSLQKHEIEHFQLNMDNGLKSVQNSPKEPAKALPFMSEPEHNDRSLTPLRERIVDVLTVEDDVLTFHQLMYKLDLDSDDDEMALEVDNELAAGLSCTPPVYARDEDGEWGLAEWVTEDTTSTVNSVLREEILAVLRVAGDKGMTNTALAKSLGQDIEHIDSELDALKHNGLATGRGGRGKRWHAVTVEAK